MCTISCFYILPALQLCLSVLNKVTFLLVSGEEVQGLQQVTHSLTLNEIEDIRGNTSYRVHAAGTVSTANN